MKYLVAAFLLAAAPVSASGLSDPVVTPDVVVAEAEASSTDVDLLITVLFLATVITAVGVGY